MFLRQHLLKIVLSALLMVPMYCLLYATNDKKIVALEKDLFHTLHLKFDKNVLKTQKTQSLSHYLHSDLKDRVINNWGTSKKIMSKGQKNIEEILNQVLAREIELSETYYVFYHGTKIEFLLFQDVLKYFAQLNKSKPLNDFFLLRIPTDEFKRYHSVQQFLHDMEYDINDNIDPARRYLLSVNPALFGNSIHRQSSSAFCYFLDSKAALLIKPFMLVADVFAFYGLGSIYDKFSSQLYELYELLIAHEEKKTGILMQIFIPKVLVNEIAYRSLPHGLPYYNAYSADMNADSKVLLEAFQNNGPFIKSSSGLLIDTMQFRLLLNQKYLLNSDNDQSPSPIKIFRYFTQTTKIKKYLEKFDQFKKQIQRDVRLSTS